SPELLLLDEPTEDLDMDGVDWLCGALSDHPGALLVVSHHRQLLRGFEHFFVLEESGCRYFHGPFGALEHDLKERHERGQRRYASKLSHLEDRERHDVTVRRRRRRKKNLGRLHVEARGVSRARLGEKKGYAQNSQAKAAKIRRDRLAADRAWAETARRALAVRLPLELATPTLPDDDGRPRVTVRALDVEVGGRQLVARLDLSLGRVRLAVIGPNGAGKSSLLSVLRGDRAPTRGRVEVHPNLGSIAQGATDWMRPDSLVELLLDQDPRLSPDRAAAIVNAHAFPLGLALRPLDTLSAGERTRAALIALFQQAPEVLILDEPTYSLDLWAASALAESLARWPGALIVATHDRAFLDEVGFSRRLRLGPEPQEPGVVSMTSPP
ncbi:MAG: ATP-binding cassette domain-containing protein, partial [Polyangiaceae bacterium]